MRAKPAVQRGIAIAVVLSLATVSACTDRVTSLTPAAAVPMSARADDSRAPQNTASARWSAIARDFIAAKPDAEKPSQNAAFRVFAYLSLAQYRAVLAAQHSSGAPPQVSSRGAVAAASSVVLGALFPADAAVFASLLRAQESEVAGSKHAADAFAAGEALGRTVGSRIVELARTDGFDAVWTGTVPTGPGFWSSDFDPPRPPVLPLLGRMRPFFLKSGDQFRPGPPPAFGSPEYLTDLAEIRSLSDHRTAEQLASAQFWALNSGSLVAGFWDGEATKLIEGHHLDERRAAHVLALSHMATMDALIACHDAKYTYWLIRPYRADPAIITAIPRPQHPSYPSNHACVSGTSAYVLGALFPAEAARLAAMADQAGESRLYAGIHYRFDKNAALGIARRVAALALSRDVGGAPHERSVRR